MIRTPLSEKPLVPLARLDRVAHRLNAAEFDCFLGDETNVRFPLWLVGIQQRIVRPEEAALCEHFFLDTCSMTRSGNLPQDFRMVGRVLANRELRVGMASDVRSVNPRGSGRVRLCVLGLRPALSFSFSEN